MENKECLKYWGLEMRLLDFIRLVRAEKIPFEGKNPHMRFEYVKLDALESAVARVCERTNFNFFQREMVHVGDNIWRVIYEYGNHGKTVQFEVRGDTAQRNAVQGSGATSTYISRYALMRLFGISQEQDDPDFAVEDKKPTKAKATAKPVQVKPIVKRTQNVQNDVKPVKIELKPKGLYKAVKIKEEEDEYEEVENDNIKIY